MKRRACVPLLLAALAAVPAARAGNYMSGTWNSKSEGTRGGAYYVREADGMVGPYGQPIPAMAPASYREPTGAAYAQQVLAQSMPPQMLQQANYPPPGQALPRGPAPCGPNGCGPMGPMMPGAGPGAMPGGLPPGLMPGGPMPPGGPGVNSGAYNGPPGAVAAVGVLGGPGGPPYGAARTEVRFTGPVGMKISWYAPRADGRVGFTAQYLEAPARYNFLQASIYRLKLSDIPGRPGIELYPTLEIVPGNAKTTTFLAHSAVPIRFTEEDLEQVAAGNFIVKVIYLPDPQFQDLAATGPDEVVSSRLEPGVDPLVEAKRRGSILAVVRLGDIDLEAPNTPSMDAPPPGAGPPPPPGAGNAPPPGPGNAPPPGAGMSAAPMMPQMPVMPMMQYPASPAVPAPKATTPVNTDAPTVPTPGTPETNKAPATPLGKLPVTGQVQPTGGSVAAPNPPASPEAPKPAPRTQKTTLMDLLGKPTSGR